MKPISLTLSFTVLSLITACSSMRDDCCKVADTRATASSKGNWIVLFDGKATDQLHGYHQDSFPKDNWVIDNGSLKTVPGKSVDLITRDQFQNFELEYEWKVAPGGNSGVIYNASEAEKEPWMSGPEMQVLDDSKHPDGKNPKTTAGSLYALIAPNDQKKLLPVGQFNKARIVARNGHVEHWLNGVKILDYQWGSADIKDRIRQSKFKDMPNFMSQASGHIDFQHHGDEVWFRNMRVRKL